METKQRYYTAYVAIACGALYYAQRLSQPGRTVIDWIVMGLIAVAIVWNMVQLNRKLYAAEGRKALWHIQRTACFWLVGLLNTLMLKPEDLNTWKHGLGWLFILAAIADSI